MNYVCSNWGCPGTGTHHIHSPKMPNVVPHTNSPIDNDIIFHYLLFICHGAAFDDAVTLQLMTNEGGSQAASIGRAAAAAAHMPKISNNHNAWRTRNITMVLPCFASIGINCISGKYCSYTFIVLYSYRVVVGAVAFILMKLIIGDWPEECRTEYTIAIFKYCLGAIIIFCSFGSLDTAQENSLGKFLFVFLYRKIVSFALRYSFQVLHAYLTIFHEVMRSFI